MDRSKFHPHGQQPQQPEGAQTGFDAANARVAALEGKVQAAAATIATLRNEVSQMRAELTASAVLMAKLELAIKPKGPDQFWSSGDENTPDWRSFTAASGSGGGI